MKCIVAILVLAFVATAMAGVVAPAAYSYGYGLAAPAAYGYGLAAPAYGYSALGYRGLAHPYGYGVYGAGLRYY